MNVDAGLFRRVEGGKPDNQGGCRSVRYACVYTHPQAERWATDNLQRQGYQPYLPTCTVWVRDRAIPSLLHPVIRPLFRRYLFLPFDHTHESWSPVRATPGVAGLLRSGLQVHYASEAEIQRLRDTEEARLRPPRPDGGWRPGMACRLAAGPLEGREAVVMEVEDQTALVAVLLFGGLRETLVALEALTQREQP